MECLFPNFDYALVDKDGGTRVVPREESSAFLTKHLRSYGGSGKYEDYRVGRLLRNLSFSGKGLVSKPANPRSVILEGNRFFDESEAQILTISSIKENDMSDLDKQIVDLRTELAEAKAANEALKEKVVAEQQAEFESKIQALEATIAEQAEAVKTKEEAIKDKEKALKEKDEAISKAADDMKEKMEELRKMKKKEAMDKRKAQLEDIGLDAEEAEATLAAFEEADDETFDKVAIALRTMAEKHPEKEEEKEKAKKEMAKKEMAKKEMAKKEMAAKEQEAKAEEELDSAEAGEEALEQVEPVEEVAIAELDEQEDPAESLRSVASEWLGSVLQTLPKQK